MNQILKNIADLSGMTIDGDIKSGRIFGVYGPGNPSVVLTDLLAGSGNNFMMVGDTAAGAPRKLLLLPRNSNAVTPPGPTAAASSEGENPDVDTPDEDPPGPGAIIHVPPAGSEDPQERSQQNLQRLQQMHDQQEQQNAPQ